MSGVTGGPDNSFQSPDEVGAWMQFVLNRAMGFQGSCESFGVGAVMADADNIIRGVRQRMEQMELRNRLTPIRKGVLDTPPGSAN